MPGSLLRFTRLWRGFLREATLQVLQLRVDLIDFVGFVIGGGRLLPFGKRALEQFGGALVLPGFDVHVAEMTENRRVMALPVDRLAQTFFGLGELVLLVVGPAEAVEIRSVVRLLLHGALNHRGSLVETDTAV